MEGAISNLTRPDIVNHPSHYTGGNIECIDAIKEATKELQGIEATDTGNAIKYLWRWKRKNGIEDLKKAVWYIKHLIEEKESLSTVEQLRVLHAEKMELDARIELLTAQHHKEEFEQDVGL